MIRWSLEKRGTATPGLIYNRQDRVLGTAIDADGGPSAMWTNVQEADVHALADKHGALKDLGPAASSSDTP